MSSSMPPWEVKGHRHFGVNGQPPKPGHNFGLEVLWKNELLWGKFIDLGGWFVVFYGI